MKMKKRITRLVSLLSLLTMTTVLSSCGEKTYVSKYAYKEYDRSVYVMDREKLQIGIFDFNKKAIDEAHVKDLAEFGADYIIHAGSNSEEFYGWCEKYGLGVISKNLNVPRYVADKNEDAGIEGYEELRTDYKDYPALWGEDIFDEPSSVHFGWMGQAVENFRVQQSAKLPFINLHPMYCPDYNHYLGTDTYEAYIDKYIEEVDTDYICFDIYPFDNTQAYLYSSYIENIDLVASACRETGRDFWIITQLGVNEEYQTITPAQVRWQAYVSLAYGAKSIIHACYTPCWWAENSMPLTKDGEKNDIWYDVKALNAELHALSDAYMGYTNLGVYTVGTSDNDDLAAQLQAQSERNKNKHFTEKAMKYISDVKTDGAVMVGCFEKENSNAAILTNMMDPYNPEKSATVSFKAASDKTVTLYMDGDTKIIRPENNRYTITLECGQGAFITVE